MSAGLEYSSRYPMRYIGKRKVTPEMKARADEVLKKYDKIWGKPIRVE